MNFRGGGGGFFLTLPSNSSMDFYPSNKLSSYMTKLPETINLEGQYEVGLSQILYTHSWSNIKGATTKFQLSGATFLTYDLAIPQGHYNGPQQLITNLSRVLKAVPDAEGVDVSYEPVSKKVTVSIEEGSNKFITFSKPLTNMLGLEE